MNNSSGILIFVLKNGEGELRSGWRILIYLLLFMIFVFMLAALVAALGGVVTGGRGMRIDLLQEPPTKQPITDKGLLVVFLNRSVNLVAALAASAVCARFLERRSFASVGYKLHAGWLKDFSLGNLLGALSLALAVAISYMAGATSFAPRDATPQSILINAVILFVIFLIAAAFEEVVFRGFMFQALLHNFRVMLGERGAVATVAITSLAFGVMHAFNPSATFFSVANTMLAGVWLGAAYLKTRSLWLATALHVAWNYVMVFAFGLPVSGITMFNEMALVEGRSGPPVWLSGGDYGPEGGAAATLALILSLALIIKWRALRASEDMLIATRHGSTERRVDAPPAESSEA
ncbi:MAG TPA: CPBP family intramembrane glutamic endopeptidase [Blastocatellia bacterium]|nr:CPBP family intramembrane glutamic endopeptidase [Blastocatellia bacterium]